VVRSRLDAELMGNGANSRQILGAALQRSTEYTEETTDLDVADAVKEVTGRHEDQAGDRAAGREESIGRGNGRRRDAVVSRLALGWEVEESIPAGLPDGAADDGSAISICLIGIESCRSAQASSVEKKKRGCAPHARAGDGQSSGDRAVAGRAAVSQRTVPPMATKAMMSLL
jgi:hypothetical protein